MSITGQDFSNKGKDFWLVYPDHVDANNSSMGIYITSDINASGVIVVGATSIPFTVTANAVTRKFIGPNGQGDASNIGIVHTLPDGILAGAGIHVTADQPVVVYAHIIRTSRSGATLALPVSVLGKEYIVPSYRSAGASGPNSGYGEVTVVAPEANTVVEITPVANSRSGTRQPGIPYTITLNNPGDVYQIQFQKDADISGTRVRSIASGTGACKPIAVFSATTWSAFPCGGATGGDNLFQQLFPIKSWGKTFVTAPFYNRSYDIIRVFISDPATVVRKTENGQTITLANINVAGFYEFTTNNPVLIEADKPVSAVQYLVSQTCGLPGTNADPEMVILNPVEQTINNITVFSAHQNWVPVGQSNVNQCYLNIIIKSSLAASFRINNNLPTASFVNIPGTDYAYLQENVSVLSQTNPVQNLRADSAFIAIAYGYGQYESYGYNAGTSVRDLSQFIEVSNLLATVNFPATCRNAPFGLSIVLSYQPTQINWKAALIPLDTTILNPVTDSTWVQDGKTLYRYKLKKTLRVPNTGTIPVKVITNNPTADGCGSLQEIDYDLQVFENPMARFTYTNNGCINDSVKLLDATSINGGRPTIAWSWDLGDNTRSSIRNPAHLYATGGDYPVRLSVINDIGCLSDTGTQIINLSNLPVADFTLPTNPICVGRAFTLTSQSTPGSGSLVNYQWDFGDGRNISYTSGDPVITDYASPGNYYIKLTVTNNRLCVSKPDSLLVRVGVVPIPGFILPEVCLSDAFAQFTDSSKISDGTAGQLTYAWALGDGSFSTDRNPRHKYNSAAVYSIKQVVTSSQGCVDSLIRPFTVNGAVPNASFTVQNQGVLCSNREISIINNSMVDFGNITRLEIFWDALNNPGQSEADETPTTGKIYTHTYPVFGTPLTKTFTIRFVAYSGQSCVSEVSRVITLQASPQLTFTPLGPVCEEMEAFQITQARENAGLAGTGIFSGTGVSASGIFDPVAARPGNYTIRYTFNAANGCTAFREQSIQVDPTPRVDAGPDRTVLEGGFIIINGTSTGTGLRINWTPSTGLDNPVILTPRATPTEDTRYTLQVTSGQGCSASDDVFVKVLLKPVIPNTFTPNGDGYNDLWEIRSLDSYPGCIVEVYNTTGALIFRSVGYNKPWDGTWNGKPVPAGTYYYVIDPKNGRSKIAGYVTVFK